MSKDFIKKLLREHLKRIIVKPEDGDNYNLDESFDKPLNLTNKPDSMTYIVSEDDIRAKITFRMEFNNGDDLDEFKIIKPKSIDKYFSVVWEFIDNTKPTASNWMRVTATLFPVIDDFIRNYKPKLIVFSSRKKTGDVYYRTDFISKLNSLFPDYYIKAYPEYDHILILRKDYSMLKEGTISKSIEFKDFKTLDEAIKHYLYKHKNKSILKGIEKNTIRKEQVQRIINKLRYLY